MKLTEVLRNMGVRDDGGTGGSRDPVTPMQLSSGSDEVKGMLQEHRRIFQTKAA